MFGAFIAYQLYRYTYTHEIALILLSIFDLFVIALAVHEYRLLRSTSRPAKRHRRAMQRLTLAGGIPDSSEGSIVALGNFDGFHLGHQAVVGRAIPRGFHERRPVIVATFDPHPVRFFKPDLPPFRLTTLDQREELFAHAGADAMLVFEFDEALRSTSAEDFVAELLGQRIGAAGVVTGDDFTFGKMRGGNVELLRTLGAEHGIVAEAVAPVLLGGERISSGPDPRGAGRRRHRDRDPAAQPRLCDRGRGPARRRARPRARLSDRQPRRSATISGPNTASMPCA